MYRSIGQSRSNRDVKMRKLAMSPIFSIARDVLTALSARIDAAIKDLRDDALEIAALEPGYGTT